MALSLGAAVVDGSMSKSYKFVNIEIRRLLGELQVISG
jgi:hypothetical protein